MKSQRNVMARKLTSAKCLPAQKTALSPSSMCLQTFSLCASHSRFDNLLQLALNNSTLYSLERDSIQNWSEMVGTTNNEKVSWSVADRADKNQQRKIDDSFTSADSLSFLLRGQFVLVGLNRNACRTPTTKCTLTHSMEHGARVRSHTSACIYKYKY